MGFLDVTIVNIAFPDIERDFAAGLASRPVLGPQRLQHRLRRRCSSRPAGWPICVGRRRMFFVGVGAFLDRVGAVRGGGLGLRGCVAARVCSRPPAGAVLVPTSLALLLPEFPAERRATASRDLERDRRRRRGARTVARRRARRPARLALGLLRQRADRAAPRWCRRGALLRETRDPDAVLPDALGSALLVAGVGALALGIVKGSDWGWDSTRVLGALAAAAVLLPAVVVRSARHRAPVIELSLFRVRSFAVANAGMFALLDGLLRAAAVQHPVPDPGLGLVDPHGGLRRDARAADGGRDGAACGTPGGPLRPASGRAPGSAAVRRSAARCSRAGWARRPPTRASTSCRRC